MPKDAIDASLLRALEGDGDYRLLRRLDVRDGPTGRGERTGLVVGIALDVETTGLGDDDVVIELAMRRFVSDRAGVIVKVDRMYSWLEDPGRPIAPDVSRLTGIDDAMLAGRTIEEEEALGLLRSAEYVVAHNAGFDRGMVERRFPGIAGELAWACSRDDVDWRGHGFEGRALGWLLGQNGLFHAAHRAAGDVDAVIALLGQELPSGGTVLAEMLARARAPSWRFRAVGASFDVKDALRARGYRWDAVREPRHWWRDVADADRDQEEWWLAGNVYAADARPRASGPVVERVTWRERYR